MTGRATVNLPDIDDDYIGQIALDALEIDLLTPHQDIVLARKISGEEVLAGSIQMVPWIIREELR